MEVLGPERVRAGLEGLEGWEAVDGAIRREFRFGGFREAIDFIVRVAGLAEEADHHPEIRNVYDRVTLELTTHSAGGVTHRDLELARGIQGVVQD